MLHQAAGIVGEELALTTHIAFLRAVNVGGRVVRMERLRAIFEGLGFADVRTYIQSGNVFFDSPGEGRAALQRKIEARLRKDLGYEVEAMVRTVTEVEAALARDAFAGVEVSEHTRLCVVFLHQGRPPKVALPARSPKGDVEVLDATDGEAFVVLNQQPGRAVNALPFLTKLFGQPTTSRFHATTQKIVAAAKKR
ncbi:MAG: DUF1697 domain-containing protein [Deltaproteobacteria bacterium]|nr:DUF1697 domain-containing protein [Deltaproteobacteria bacterium]